MKSLQILIVDDHELIRSGLRQLLESQPGWKVCGEAEHGRQAVDLAAELHPDIVVMDISMPELNGLEAMRQIVKTHSDTRVLILTMHESREVLEQVRAAGGRGCVLKSDTQRLLVAGIETLAKGKLFFSNRLSENHNHSNHFDKNSKAKKAPRRRLTEREREVVQFVAKGNSNKEIAAKLSLSIKTVDAHRANAMRKLDLHSVADLVRFAIRSKIIDA